MQIKKLAVIGSGVMGSGIAALSANAGVPVVLLDIVPKDAENRNKLAEEAIARQLKSGGFTHPSRARYVTAGNMDDHLHLLKEVDWIIEAVVERLDIKQSVYKKIDSMRKQGSVVSSNTSTIPIHTLLEGLSEHFRRDFMIAHFFNPPRHMRLLEVVPSPHMPDDKFHSICRFADVTLGKEIVRCKDTPGFIANRIGVYWLTLAMNKALALGLTVEEADALMSKPIGVPKTGVFGLYDLIGIDLMALIADELLALLPPDDPFRTLDPKPPLIKKMIDDGYTGRKGKGGFYRMDKQGDKKIMQALDLQTGDYRPAGKAELASAKSKNIAELLAASDKGGAYARAVMLPFLHYTASLLGEIADDIHAVDTAMKTGYNWKYGPFELIDQIGTREALAAMQQQGLTEPPLLDLADGQKLYKAPPPEMFTLNDSYLPVPKPEGVLQLADLKVRGKALLSNKAAALWDMGGGVACFEIATKMSAIDDDVLEVGEQAMERVKKDFQALVIGSDAPYFCAGANIAWFLEKARAGEFDAISQLIKRGQRLVMALKYAPFPVVSAAGGLALGGGCELLLHSKAVQAHMELNAGLVEGNVGLIPAWGGCKEMLLRHDDPLVAFSYILSAKTSGSADEALEMNIIKEGGITMNRNRLLADARALAKSLAPNYAPPTPPTISVPSGTRDKLLATLEEKQQAERLSPHSVTIGKTLAQVLSCGGRTSASETDMLTLEHDGFMELIKTPPSQARIEHMLNTGKPLRN